MDMSAARAVNPRVHLGECSTHLGQHFVQSGFAGQDSDLDWDPKMVGSKRSVTGERYLTSLNPMTHQDIGDRFKG
jgi:hypothetical protein